MKSRGARSPTVATRARGVATILCALLLLPAAAVARASISALRPLGVVALQGAELHALSGAPIGRLGLFARTPSGLEPIPFQIDERDPHEEWVLTLGLEAGTDDDGGRLDANDELLFLIDDAGLHPLEGPEGAERSLGIEVVDPTSGEPRWVVLAEYATAPPRSPVRHVHLDVATDSIESANYALTFSRAIPISWAFLAAKTPDGSPGPNLIDRIKVRMSCSLLFGLVELRLNEEELRSMPVGYVDGPIRALRRVENSVEFGLGLESPTYLSDTVYYRNAIFAPAFVDIVFDVGLFLQDLELKTYIDFRQLDGWSFYHARDPIPVPFDGVMSETERELHGRPVDWIGVTHDAQGIIARYLVDSELTAVKQSLVYVDDATRPDPPEADPGLAPALGFTLSHFDGVKAGAYETVVEIYVVNDFEKGREDTFLAVQGRSPGIRVRQLP